MRVLSRRILLSTLLAAALGILVFRPAPAHATTNKTITVDATLSDWSADETFAVFNSADLRVTWDATNVYFSWNKGSTCVDSDVIWVYFDVQGGGTTTSANWGSGTHTLPFLADTFIAYQPNGSVYDIFEWTGAWTWRSNTFGSKAQNYAGGIVEVSLPRSLLGSPSTCTAVLLIMNNDNDFIYSAAPPVNPQGVPTQDFAAYLTWPLVSGISPNDPRYFRSKWSWQAPVAAPASFTPVVDGVKDAGWGSTPQATSASTKEPVAGAGDTGAKVPTGGMARDIYVTNDAQWLYIGWKAFADPFALETDQTEQEAHYDFVITDTSSWGSSYDPFRSSGQTRVEGYGAEVWLSGWVEFLAPTFVQYERRTSNGLSWNSPQTILTQGSDWNVLFDSGPEGWGEIRVPLSLIGSDGVGPGETIAIVHYARHSAPKPGISDLTPYDNSAPSDWGNNNAVIRLRDTAVCVYVIQQGVVTARHIPETTPVAGKGKMRTPDTITLQAGPLVRVRVEPNGVLASGLVYYSPDTWATSFSKSLVSSFTSGGADYYDVTLPAYARDTTVRYYFQLNTDEMVTYLYGSDTSSSTTTSQATAQNNAFSYKVKNSTPSGATSIAVVPLVAADADSLVATASGAIDADTGDPVVYRFEWRKNNSPATLLTTFDATAPFQSTLPADSSAVGDSWTVFVTAGDGVDTGTLIEGPTALVSQIAVWDGVAPLLANRAAVSNGEWIWVDKTGEERGAPLAEADLREMRIQADSTFLYFLIRLGAFDDRNEPFVAVSFDTDRVPGSGGDEIGDQSFTLLDSAATTPPARWESQIAFHATTYDSLTAEINRGAGWVSPSSGFQIQTTRTAGIIEAKVRRSDLLLAGPDTARIAIATFRNVLGPAQTIDATEDQSLHDALDAASHPIGLGNDATNYMTAWNEDLSDADLDLWFELRLSDSVVVPDAAPGSPPSPSPAGGETAVQNPPVFTWGAASDPGDSIVLYLFELGVTGVNLDETITYRIVTSETTYTPSSALTDSLFYAWRVRGIDAAGVLGTGSTQTFFMDPAVAISIPAPRDDQNLSNFNVRTGLEVAATSADWYWVAGDHSKNSQIDSYVFQVSSSLAFDTDVFTDTVDAIVRSYTPAGLSRGRTYYARVRGIDTGGFLGAFSAASDGIYVSRRQVNGDTSEWASAAAMAFDTAALFASYGEGIWNDSPVDQRTDSPGNAERDLRELHITADAYNLYVFLKYPTPATSLVVQIAVSYDASSDQRTFEGRNVIPEDSYTSNEAAWERLIKFWRNETDDVWVVTPSFQSQRIRGAYLENIGQSTIEFAVPLERLGGAGKFLGKTVRFTVASFNVAAGGGVAQVGGANSNIEDAVTTTGPSTWNEVSDRVLNYALRATFDTAGLVTAFAGETLPSLVPPEKSDNNGSPAASNRDWIMYNLFVDRWASGRSDNQPGDLNMSGGDFEGIIANMEFLNQMGVNVVYLSPSMDYGGGEWGYNQSDLYRIQGSFVAPNPARNGFMDLANLIKEARHRNMEVFVDWVPGQIYNGRTVVNHPELFSGKRFGGERVQQDMVEARQFMADHMHHLWSVGLRGLRVDNPKFYPDDFTTGLPFFRYVRDHSDKYAPELYTYGEVPDGSSVVGSFCRDGNRLSGMLDFPLMTAYKNWANGGAPNTLTGSINGTEGDYYGGAIGNNVIMAFLPENHDHDRTYHELLGGNDLDGSKIDAIAGNIQIYYLFGAVNAEDPVIWYGDERAMTGRKNTTYPGWTYTENTSEFGNTRSYNWNDSQQLWLLGAFRDFFGARAVFSALREGRGNRSFEVADAGSRFTINRWTGAVGSQERILTALNNSDGDDPGYDAPGEGPGVMFEDWLSPGTQRTTGAGGLNMQPNAHYGEIWVKGGFGLTSLVVDAGLPGVIVSVDNNSYWTRITGPNGKATIPRVVTWDAATRNRTLRAWKSGYGILSQTVTVAVDSTQIVNITLTADDGIPPAVPTGLSAKPRDRAVDLTWDENTEGDFESYYLYRSKTPNDPGATLILECLNPTAYDNDIDNFLTNGDTYYYRVRSRDRNGNLSAYSSEAVVVPRKFTVRFYLDVAGADPAAVYTIAGNHENLGEWNTRTMTEVADEFWLFETQLDPTSRPEYKYQVTVGGATTWENDFAQNTLFTGNRLVTIDDHTGQSVAIFTNRWGQSGDVSPRAPRGVTAVGGETVISVGWQPSPEPDVKRYRVYRDTTTGSFTSLADVDAAQIRFVDTRVVAATTYYYRVSAIDWWGSEGAQQTDSKAARLVAFDTTPPAAPTGLGVDPNGLTSLLLSWSPNTEGDFFGYDLYRDTLPAVATTDANRVNTTTILPRLAPSLVDPSVTPGVTYYYRLTARDDSGNVSAASDTVTARLVNVGFRVDIGSISAVNVQVYGDPATIPAAGTSLSPISSSVWGETFGLLADVPIRFRYAYNSMITKEGNYSTGSGDREWTPLTASTQSRDDDWEEDPDGPLTPIEGFAGNRTAYLSWKADTGAEDLAGYVIDRADSTGVYSRITANPVTTTTYTDSGLSNGETYYYLIRSRDAGTILLESKAVRMAVVVPQAPVWVRFRVDAAPPRRRRET